MLRRVTKARGIDATKPVPGVVLSRADLIARVKDHGRLSRSAEVHDVLGFNSKFTDLQAGLGLAQLRKLAERIRKKKQLLQWYRESLAGAGSIAFPPIDHNETVPWFVDILCDDRPALEAHLKSAGIETRRFYLPIHGQPCYQAQGKYPNTEYIAEHGLWLPSSPALTRSDVERIASEIVATETQTMKRTVGQNS